MGASGWSGVDSSIVNERSKIIAGVCRAVGMGRLSRLVNGLQDRAYNLAACARREGELNGDIRDRYWDIYTVA